MKTKLTHSILTQVLLILPLASISLAATRLQSKIYTHLDDSLFCFRRFNETHQIGCSSNAFKTKRMIVLLFSICIFKVRNLETRE